MKAQNNYIWHKKPLIAPSGTPKVSTSALCSGETNRVTYVPDYVFIGKYNVDVFPH